MIDLFWFPTAIRLRHRAASGLVLLVAACGGDDPGINANARDSAGVRITETAALPAPPGPWRLSETAILSIGVESGDEAYELSDVRGAIRLSDGRIVVANNDTHEVRYFTSTGRHLRTTGRDGSGPGEFRSLAWIGRLDGDSVAVYDRRQRRITYLNPQGEYIRDVGLRNNDRFFVPDFLGVLTNGMFAAQYPIRLRGGPDAPLGMGRDSVVVITIDRDGGVQDTIGVFASQVIEVLMREAAGNRRRLPGILPFTPRTVVASGAAVIAVANTGAVDIKHFQLDRTLRRITRSPAESIGVEERHRDYVVDSLRTRYAHLLNAPEVSLLIRKTETSPLPESFPVFDSLAVDANGNLWLAAYRLPGGTTVAWTVYRNDGSLIGLVQGPTGFRATEFGLDYVLGVTSGALGVQRVEMYRLIKR